MVESCETPQYSRPILQDQALGTVELLSCVLNCACVKEIICSFISFRLTGNPELRMVKVPLHLPLALTAPAYTSAALHRQTKHTARSTRCSAVFARLLQSALGQGGRWLGSWFTLSSSSTTSEDTCKDIFHFHFKQMFTIEEKLISGSH